MRDIPEFHKIRPLLKYINDLMACKCFPDLLEANIFPNTKELTESMAPFHFCRWHLQDRFPLGDRSVSLFSVGDGRTPRTAALFAYRTAWTCYSIDPNLNTLRSYRTKRLVLVKKRIEDFKITVDKAVIVAVHSHAPPDVAVKHIRANDRVVIAIPCCVPQEIPGYPPDIEYQDRAIWSEKNTVRIWLFQGGANGGTSRAERTAGLPNKG